MENLDIKQLEEEAKTNGESFAIKYGLTLNELDAFLAGNYSVLEGKKEIDKDQLDSKYTNIGI